MRLKIPDRCPADPPSLHLGGDATLPLTLWGGVTYTSVTPDRVGGGPRAGARADTANRRHLGFALRQRWEMGPASALPKPNRLETLATPPAGGAGGVFKSRRRRPGIRSCGPGGPRPGPRGSFAQPPSSRQPRRPAPPSLRGLQALASASPARPAGSGQLPREPAGSPRPLYSPGARRGRLGPWCPPRPSPPPRGGRARQSRSTRRPGGPLRCPAWHPRTAPRRPPRGRRWSWRGRRAPSPLSLRRAAGAGWWCWRPCGATGRCSASRTPAGCSSCPCWRPSGPRRITRWSLRQVRPDARRGQPRGTGSDPRSVPLVRSVRPRSRVLFAGSLCARGCEMRVCPIANAACRSWGLGEPVFVLSPDVGTVCLETSRLI